MASDNYGSIILDCIFSTVRIRIGTKIRVTDIVKHWDAKNQRLRSSFGVGYGDWNMIINQYRNAANETHRKFTLERVKFDSEIFLKRFWRVLDGIDDQPEEITSLHGVPNKKWTLEETAKKFIKENKPIRSKKYLSGLESVVKRVNEYHPGTKLSDLTKPFFLAYISYLIDEYELVNETIRVHKKWLANVLNYADVNNGQAKWEVPKGHGERIWLDENEVMKLYNYEFDTVIQRSVDIYLFVCFMGLRAQDLKQVTTDNLRDGYLHIVMYKTRKKLKLAINEYAAGILAKYHNSLPLEGLTDVNTNIKTAAKLCGIDSTYTITSYSGSSRKDTVVNKSDVISLYTARHTFATNSLIRGMKIEVLQQLMGHSSIDTTLVYARIIDSVKDKAMLDLWKKPTEDIILLS